MNPPRNTKIFAAGFLTLGLVVVLFIRFLFSRGTNEFLLNGLLLIVVGILGWLLNRSVSKEITAKEELKRLEHLKSEFVSIVSHQLRSPLSAMKGYLSMALEGMLGPLTVGLQEKLSRVYQSNERLIRLVSDLLDLSKIERGKIDYKFTTMDVGQSLKNVVEDLQVLAKEKRLKLKSEIPLELPTIKGDEEKLRQVFINLLENAFHYTPSGSITVSAKATPKTLNITFKDTGIGISEKDMPHLFDEFQRGSEVNQFYTEGMGLGLYVAKRIVEDHDGKIWAESKGTGKGSTFFVELLVKN